VPAWLRELQKTLLSLPEEIYSSEETLFQSSSALTDAQASLKIAESAISSAVSAEIDSMTNKAKYSNETSRAAEVLRRRQTDAAYVAAEKVVDDIHQRTAKGRMHLGLLRDRFSAARHLSDLYAAYLSPKN
jgi:hypothetical protein